jgi:hypothetical protein
MYAYRMHGELLVALDDIVRETLYQEYPTELVVEGECDWHWPNKLIHTLWLRPTTLCSLYDVDKLEMEVRIPQKVVDDLTALPTRTR